MQQVWPRLYVGNVQDGFSTMDNPDWFVVHACREPFHRRALGYTGRSAPHDHPQYLMAVTENGIAMNFLDAKTRDFIMDEMIDGALDHIDANIKNKNVLVHCNLGMSRGPAIALLYLDEKTAAFEGLSVDQAIEKFRGWYAAYAPGAGVDSYVRFRMAENRGNGSFTNL